MTLGYPGRSPEWLTSRAAFQQCLGPLAVGDAALGAWRCVGSEVRCLRVLTQTQGGAGVALHSPSSAPPPPAGQQLL